jgi:hypothetical protein
MFAGGKFYDIYDSLTLSAAVDVFNASSNQWSTAQLSHARVHLAATSVGPYLMFAGGQCSDDDAQCSNGDSAVVDLFDLISQQWYYMELSEARSSLSAASTGFFAIFAGGIHGGSPSSTVDILDVSVMQWSTAQLSVPRSSLAAVSFGTFAIFAGGAYEKYDSVYEQMDLFNGLLKTWSQSNLSKPRGYMGATSVGSVAIFAGGCYVDPDWYDYICYKTVDTYNNSDS